MRVYRINYFKYEVTIIFHRMQLRLDWFNKQITETWKRITAFNIVIDIVKLRS